MRKRRADSQLFSLPEATQQAIWKLEERDSKTLQEIRDLLMMPEPEGGFGVGSVSIASVSNFLKEWRTRAWRESLHAAAATAQGVKDTLNDDDRDSIDEAIYDGVREWMLDSIVSRQIDAATAKGLIALIQKRRAQELDERKLAILEKKAAQADAASGVAKDAALTPEEKQRRLEGIFGF